jgi:hypothetical protein
MVTVVLHRGIQDEESLAGLANGILERYKSARGMILGTQSKPRTPQAPAEHFMAAVFPEPTRIEVAFARVLLADGIACVLVYSHREYGEKIGDRVSAWLKANGPRVEQQLMSWDAFPRPGAFTPASTKAPGK